jgi:hypothetical protein
MLALNVEHKHDDKSQAWGSSGYEPPDDQNRLKGPIEAPVAQWQLAASLVRRHIRELWRSQVHRRTASVPYG